MLTSGTVFGQGITVLILPLLTRLYSPSEFSLLAVFSSLTGMVVVFSSLRYNIAIPLPENDVDAFLLLVLALASGFFFSLISASMVFFIPEDYLTLIVPQGLLQFLWMFPFAVFLASSYDALQYWASRKRRFNIIAKTRVTRAVGGGIVQCILGLVGFSAFGLILGYIANSGLGIPGLVRKTCFDNLALFRAINLQSLYTQAKIYWRFPIFSVPEAAFSTAANELPLIMIAAWAGGAEAGFLFLAMRIMGLPMSLIGSSISQVYLVEAPSRLRAGTLNTFTHSTMWSLFKVAAPILLLIGALSPFLFPIVFGKSWARAGVLVAWMTPWFIAQFIASPVSMVLHVMGRQKLAAILQFIGFVFRCGATFLFLGLSPELASEAFAISSMFFYFLYIVVIKKVIGAYQ